MSEATTDPSAAPGDPSEALADPSEATADTSEALAARLRAEGLAASAWGNGPGDRYAPHDHGYDKVLVVAAGSIRFGLPGSAEVADLDVGDRLDLPAGTVHDALVGPDGVTCLEAHVPAGTLTAVRRVPAGAW